MEELQEKLGLFPVSLIVKHNIHSFNEILIWCLFWIRHIIRIFILFSKTESNLSKEMELVIKDIKNTTQKKYMDYGKNPGSPDNDFLFMYSVAR